jgi:hypothetical protein
MAVFLSDRQTRVSATTESAYRPMQQAGWQTSSSCTAKACAAAPGAPSPGEGSQTSPPPYLLSGCASYRSFRRRGHPATQAVCLDGHEGQHRSPRSRRHRHRGKPLPTHSSCHSPTPLKRPAKASRKRSTKHSVFAASAAVRFAVNDSGPTPTAAVATHVKVGHSSGKHHHRERTCRDCRVSFSTGGAYTQQMGGVPR